MVVAVLYPQWFGAKCGGLGMRADEESWQDGVAAYFPSQYEPFLLTALEAGREGNAQYRQQGSGL